MIIKIFNGKKIKTRELSNRDLRNVKKFQDYVNSLVGESAPILLNKKLSLKEEKEWLKKELKEIKNHKRVFLVAEAGEDNKIIGVTGIFLGRNRQSHVGEFGISVRKGYRGMGLGTYLMGKILKLAKTELKPRPKIIRLSVYPNNKPAIRLYKKLGFKRVARIPKQIEYKGKLIDEIIMLKYV
jgi:RimJ/RimL family protein N-acetyltransferase